MPELSHALRRQDVVLTYDICSLIASYANPGTRARLMRTNRTVFDHVVGMQYTSVYLADLLRHNYGPLGEYRRTTYSESVQRIDLTGSTPYNIEDGNMNSLFRHYPKLRGIKWVGGELEGRASGSEGTFSLRYVLNVDLREENGLSDADYMWSSPPSIPDWTTKCGLHKDDAVTYRIRYSPADWLFHPEGLVEVEDFIARPTSIDVLDVEDHNTAQLPQVLALLKRIKPGGRPKTLRFQRLRLDHRSVEMESLALLGNMDELSKLCGRVELNLRESLDLTRSGELGNDLKARYALLTHDSACHRQGLDRIVERVERTFAAVSYSFSLRFPPQRYIMIDWTRRSDPDELNTLDPVVVRIRAEGTTCTDGVEVFDASRYDYNLDGPCLLDLIDRLVDDSHVRYELNIVGPVSKSGVDEALEPYTSRARCIMRRYIDRTPRLSSRMREWTDE